ncbi:MAG TPA: hypothetical protein VKP65_22900 [Rhodothermales bacterium]|nr:hypothetical protein [Rhodothermales bacterium]
MSNRPTFYLLGCMGLTLLLLGFTTLSFSSTAPPAKAVQAVLATAIASPFLSEDDLVRSLGEPEAIRTETVANAYDDGQTDTVRHLTYDGLSLSIYEVADPHKSILYHIELTSGSYTSPEGIRVGQPKQDVLSTLGNPTLRAADRYVYAGSDAHPVDLVVSLTNDRVSQLAWMVHFE